MSQEKYLSVLAKVINTQAFHDESMEELYRLVEDEFYETMKRQSVPSMPDLSQRMEELLSTVEACLSVPELIGKRVIALYHQNVNMLFRWIKGELKENRMGWIEKQPIQIPLVLLPGEKIAIRAFGNQFGSVSLTEKEFRLLLKESWNQKIALNQIVKLFVVEMPLAADCCFILDNLYRVSDSMFAHVITKKIIWVSEEDISSLKDYYFDDKDYVLADSVIQKKLLEKGFLKNRTECIQTLSEDTFGECCNKICFEDQLNYALCKIKEYYGLESKSLQEGKNALRNDLIIKENKILQTYFDEMESEQKRLECEQNAMNQIIQRIYGIIRNLDEQVGRKIPASASQLSARHKDMIFTYYFSVAGYDLMQEKECVKHLSNLKYAHLDLLLKYSASLRKKVGNYQGETDSDDWEVAKMLVSFRTERDRSEDLRRQLETIGTRRFTSGKEWYFWGCLQKDENALKKAVEMDYAPAADALYELHKNDEDWLRFLAANFHELAGLKLGELQIAEEQENCTLDICSLKDEHLVYFKIAAIAGNLYAVQRIADLIYQNKVWPYFSVYGKPVTEDAELLKACQQVAALSEHLIAQGCEVKKNKEIHAVCLFCMNWNMGEVEKMFYSESSDAAFYCKGYLREFGISVPKSDANALDKYEKVTAKVVPAVTNAKRRVKQRLQREKEKKEREYQKENDYREQSSSTYYNSGCFITTAASCALGKGSDCAELNFLRAFRDHHIKGDMQGDAMVREYYRVAPKIIERINLEENASDIYAALWHDYIEPSVKSIESGKSREAQDIYVAMVVELSRKYGVEIQTEGYEQLYADTLKRLNK